jgi:YegS/Rv2252/BmrU family lipid kinase
MGQHFRSYFVVNPHAAAGRTGRVWPAIKSQAEALLGPVDFGLTERQGHAVMLTRAALKEGFEMIVAVGGDGTNNEVVNGFFEDDRVINPEAVFAVVCSGTGSDLIKTVGVPREFEKSLPLLAGREAKATDVGRMIFHDHHGRETRRYFINIASFGVGGEVDERVNRTSKILGGRASFLWASLLGSLAYKNKPVTITLDNGEPLERTVFNVAVANGRFFGAGMQTAPHAAVDDGLFDVVILGDLALVDQIKLMSAIYKGQHLTQPKVESFRCRTVRATSPERVLLDVDGEQPGMLPAAFEIIPAALRMKRP